MHAETPETNFPERLFHEKPDSGQGRKPPNRLSEKVGSKEARPKIPASREVRLPKTALSRAVRFSASRQLSK